jgi:hypothetical protein
MSDRSIEAPDIAHEGASALDAPFAAPAGVCDTPAGRVPAMFHYPRFATFIVLVTGLIAAPARRTVCGLLPG